MYFTTFFFLIGKKLNSELRLFFPQGGKKKSHATWGQRRVTQKGITGPSWENNTRFSAFQIPGSATEQTVHPHPTKPQEATHLTEVNKKRAGGPIHSVFCVAGIRAPHIFHPLKQPEKVRTLMSSLISEARHTCQQRRRGLGGGGGWLKPWPEAQDPWAEVRTRCSALGRSWLELGLSRGLWSGQRP